SNFLSHSSLVIVEFDSNVRREPLNNATHSKSLNVVTTAFIRIARSTDRNDSSYAMLKHGHDEILTKGGRRLVDVGFHVQTVVDTAIIHMFLETTFLIQLHMLDLNERGVNTNSSVD